MITFLKSQRVLKFWVLENPKTRIHTLNPWLGKPKEICNPCDFALLDPVPHESLYNKETWLFGDFKKLTRAPLPPVYKASLIHTNFGGKSLRTKNARSGTPKGLAEAFATANA